MRCLKSVNFLILSNNNLNTANDGWSGFIFFKNNLFPILENKNFSHKNSFYWDFSRFYEWEAFLKMLIKIVESNVLK